MRRASPPTLLLLTCASFLMVKTHLFLPPTQPADVRIEAAKATETIIRQLRPINSATASGVPKEQLEQRTAALTRALGAATQIVTEVGLSVNRVGEAATEMANRGTAQASALDRLTTTAAHMSNTGEVAQRLSAEAEMSRTTAANVQASTRTVVDAERQISNLRNQLDSIRSEIQRPIESAPAQPSASAADGRETPSIVTTAILNSLEQERSRQKQDQQRKEYFQMVLTIITLPATLYIVLSKKYESKGKNWAYTTLGTIIGFWIR